MTDHNNGCTCGHDHKQEFLDSIEDYALLRRASTVLEEDLPEDLPFSASALMFFRTVTENAIRNSLESSRAAKSKNMVEELEFALSILTMKLFLVGSMTAHHFADKCGVSTVHITDEMVEKERENYANFLNAPDGIPPQVMEFLKSMGIDPEQAKMVMLNDDQAADLMSRRQGEEDPGHGMYL